MRHMGFEYLKSPRDIKVLRVIFDTRKVEISTEELMQKCNISQYAEFINIIKHLKDLHLLSEPSKGIFSFSDNLYEDVW